MSEANIQQTVLREQQVLQRFGIGRTTWRDGVQSGKFPKPIKFSTRCVGWRVADLDALEERLAAEALESK